VKPIIALSYGELWSLLSKAKEVGDDRAHVLFLLCVSHGLRVTEALTLCVDDFTETDGKVFLSVERLKGSLDTTQELNRHDDPLLDEHTAVTRFIAGKRGRLFDLTRFGADYLIDKYGAAAGLPQHKRHMHVLKHSLGMLMRQSGADVVQIKNALGHKSINSTMQYLRPSSDEVEQARMNAFSPAAHIFPKPPMVKLALAATAGD
jgi:integrase